MPFLPVIPLPCLTDLPMIFKCYWLKGLGTLKRKVHSRNLEIIIILLLNIIISTSKFDGTSECWKHSCIISFYFYNPNKINGEVLLVLLFSRCRNEVPIEDKGLGQGHRAKILCLAFSHWNQNHFCTAIVFCMTLDKLFHLACFLIHKVNSTYVKDE